MTEERWKELREDPGAGRHVGECLNAIRDQREENERLRAVVDAARAILAYEANGQADGFTSWDEHYDRLAAAVDAFDAEVK